MVGRTLNHYDIVGKLGAGGMGEVFAAEDTRLHRRVAIKIIPAELAADHRLVERFRREAKAVAALNHPNIVTIYSVEEADGVGQFLTMELVEGKSLADVIPPGGLAADTLLAYATQLAAALEAAHGRGITHRDLKPHNIMITDDGRVKVLDFGLAKIAEPASDSDAPTQLDGDLAAATELSMTSPGAVIGTVAYMSPEQAQGKPVDHRSDLFSLGVILYEMATGERPFKGTSAAELVSGILRDTPGAVTASRSDLPRPLGELVSRCLEKDLANRAASARDLHEQLRQLLGVTSALPVVSPVPRRMRALASVIAAATVIAVVAWRLAAPPSTAAGGVVTLPCQVFASGELAYLTDAVPSNLSAYLARAGGVDTRVPPTSLQVDPGTADLSKVANAYGVDTCITCTVTVEAGRLLLAVQVVNARSGRQLWSELFEGTEHTYLALVRRSAEGIRGYLAPHAADSNPAADNAESSQAELAYRKGLYHANRFNNLRDMSDFGLAQESLKLALELDPRRAAAAAEIGFLHYRQDAISKPSAAAQAWVDKALSIDPYCGRAWTLLAFLDYDAAVIDRETAGSHALTAVHLSPRDPQAGWSLLYVVLESSAAMSLRVMSEVSSLDPLFAWGYLGKAYQLAILGRHGEAIVEVDRALELEPTMPTARAFRGVALAEVGPRAAARQLYDELDELEPDELSSDQIAAMVAIGMTSEDAPVRAATVLLIERLLTLELDWDRLSFLNYFAVPYLLRSGEIELAGRALRAYAGAGRAVPYDWWRQTPELREVDPETATMIEQLSRERLVETIRFLRAAESRGELPKYLERELATAAALLGDAR